MARLFKIVVLVAVALAPSLMVLWARSIAVQRRPPNEILTDATEDESEFDEDPVIAKLEADGQSLDSTERQVAILETDSTRGLRYFSVNGSPVEGKLKAYLDRATGRGKMPILINHPDGESTKWVEIPMPLYLYLTDQSPAP